MRVWNVSSSRRRPSRASPSILVNSMARRSGSLRPMAANWRISATALCRAVVTAVRSQVKCPRRGGSASLAISVGWASYPEDGEGKEFLLSRVDQRLISSPPEDAEDERRELDALDT